MKKLLMILALGLSACATTSAPQLLGRAMVDTCYEKCGEEGVWVIAMTDIHCECHCKDGVVWKFDKK